LLFFVAVALLSGRACLLFAKRCPLVLALLLFFEGSASPLPPRVGGGKAAASLVGVPPSRQASFISGCSLRSLTTFPPFPFPEGVGVRGRGGPDRQEQQKKQQKPLKTKTKTATTKF